MEGTELKQDEKATAVECTLGLIEESLKLVNRDRNIRVSFNTASGNIGVTVSKKIADNETISKKVTANILNEIKMDEALCVIKNFEM